YFLITGHKIKLYRNPTNSTHYQAIFETPKPEKLLQRLIHIGSVEKDTYLCKPGYEPVFILLMRKLSCRRKYYYLIGIIEWISQV
ncbi:hypothetical protein BMR11_18120, partial [Methylococcaceae bacterium CS5]